MKWDGPTMHYQQWDADRGVYYSACGSVWKVLTDGRRSVQCRRCRRTAAYRVTPRDPPK